MRKLLYDLYCSAGGSSKGYQMAGFRVIGIDIRPQPHYIGDGFIEMDALVFLDRYNAGEFERATAFSASPPCQAYSPLAAMHGGISKHPKLIEPTRERLRATRLPYVIENVPPAPLLNPLMLCGSMFGLVVARGYLRRHRLFEGTVPLMAPAACNHHGPAVGVYGHGGHSGKHRMLYRKEAAEAMQIDWMNRDELSQAIPPVYCEWIGRWLRLVVEEGVQNA